MNTRAWKWVIGIVILLGGSSFAGAAGENIIMLQDTNAEADSNSILTPIEKNVLLRLSDLENIITQMEMDGIKTVRISDGYITAQALYQTEKALVDAQKKENYTDTLKKISEMETIADLAYQAKDEIAALQLHLDQVKGEIDSTPVETILKTAKKEMREERFEKASESAQLGEDKIGELQSLDTKAKAAAEAATANIISFLDTNKYTIISIGAALLVAFLIFKNRLNHYLTKQRMHHLELERETLKNEIRRAQDDFFVKGTVPESIYNIRVKVYSTMIRNATRKIAVLSETQRKSEFKFFQNGLIKKTPPIPVPGQKTTETDNNKLFSKKNI